MPATVLSMGGGVTSDGLKDKNQDCKYYDFVAHYFVVCQPHPITGMTKVKMESSVLILE